MTAHAMIKHIYGSKYDEDHLASKPNVDQRLDFWVDVLLIANEYRVPSLTAVATSSVLKFFRDFRLDFGPRHWVTTKKDTFRRAIKRFVELENNVTLSDGSCQDGVVALLCEYSLSDLVDELHMDKILEPIEPFSARLIRSDYSNRVLMYWWLRSSQESASQLPKGMKLFKPAELSIERAA